MPVSDEFLNILEELTRPVTERLRNFINATPFFLTSYESKHC
jgi:hypothetical protein